MGHTPALEAAQVTPDEPRHAADAWYGDRNATRPLRARDDPTASTTCEHPLAALSIVLAADSPKDIALLAGLGAHESGFRTRQQVGGPAVSWFGLEVRRALRPGLLDDPFAAALRSLRTARACSSLRTYAFGSCSAGTRHQEATAAQLRACVESARRGGAWTCRSWSFPPAPRKGPGALRRSHGTRRLPADARPTLTVSAEPPEDAETRQHLARMGLVRTPHPPGGDLSRFPAGLLRRA